MIDDAQPCLRGKQDGTDDSTVFTISRLSYRLEAIRLLTFDMAAGRGIE